MKNNERLTLRSIDASPLYGAKLYLVVATPCAIVIKEIKNNAQMNF